MSTDPMWCFENYGEAAAYIDELEQQRDELLAATEQALEALWDCTVKLESQQFRNPVQIPPIYTDIIRAGYSAHTNLSDAIEKVRP